MKRLSLIARSTALSIVCVASSFGLPAQETESEREDEHVEFVEFSKAHQAQGSEVKLKPAKNNSGKWGFTDEAGTEVIPFKYDEVDEFSEGLAAVRILNKYGFVDAGGNLVVPAIYNDEIVVTDRKGGYVGTKKERVSPKKIRFSNGLAKVASNNKWGFIDKTGATVIPFKYDRASGFSADGKAMVKYGTELKMIDKNGTESEPESRWSGLPAKIADKWIADFTIDSDESGKTTIKATGTGFEIELILGRNGLNASVAMNCHFISGGKEHHSKRMSLDDDFAMTFNFDTTDRPDTVVFSLNEKPDEQIRIKN